MTEEEIEKIAKKIIELNNREREKSKRQYPLITNIRKKYHKEIYERFGATGTIEDAIRVVATYKCGQRYVSRIPEERWQEYAEYTEKIYKDILGERDTDDSK